MLTVFRSNRAELLAQVLAEQLRLHPPDPFETVAVMVNTWPTSRWLSEQLALGLGGIVANLRFPFPGAQLRRIVDPLVGDAPAGEDPWRASDLVWPVLELLPDLVREPEGEPLERWLVGRGHGWSLDLPLWQLARAIADCLDDLSLYRTAMAARWWDGHREDGRGQPLPETLLWQPLLFNRLRQRLGVRPFGLRMLEAIKQLQQGEAVAPEGVSGLRLFGLSSAPPIQVQLLQALSAAVPVDLYLLTPCAELWQRCGDRRRQLSDAIALEQPFGLDWLLETPPLEARFGRLGGEFQQLLEGTGVCQLGGSAERDLFLLPATAASLAGRPPSLLEQVQQRLADPSTPSPWIRRPRDSSLEFHAAPGRLRQVEIVRDRLLQLLAADPSLEPRHILVMTPEVERYAPLLASVFGDRAATGVELPWRLTDRSQHGGSGIVSLMLQLLRLGGERLTASALDRLLACPPLQAHFQLEPDEPAALTAALQSCGFRWGLGAQERGGRDCHGLDWALDRLLLGLVLPDRPGLAISGRAPYPLPGTIERQGRWIRVLTTLRRTLEELGQAHPAAHWSRRLPGLLDQLVGEGGDLAWEVQAIRAAIHEWQTSAAACPLPLGAPVVAAVLEERLSAESGRFGHRSGALTISALEPMRAIPHRVIVLMGLDAGRFPRHRHRPGFHPMESNRQLGDPDPADQDRYALLEAILSAREHLLICWTSRDGRRGDPLPEATPVRQWLDLLRGELGEAGFAGLRRDHAVNPLDRQNFLPEGDRPPASCDRRLLDARRRLEVSASQGAAGAGAPRPLACQPRPAPTDPAPPPPDPYVDLRDWLVAPQGEWLRSLELRPKEWNEAIEDLEALVLDERRRAALLRRELRHGGDDDPDARAPDWPAITRGQGLLPAQAAGELETRELQSRWSSLQRALTELGPARRERLGWRPAGRSTALEADLHWRADRLVLLQTAKARSCHRLELWLDLLLARSSGAEPTEAVLIARQKETFQIQERLQPPPVDEAIEHLEQLLAWREAHRRSCWPVPPSTGWAYARAEHRTPGSGVNRASERWQGQPSRPGERTEPDLALCFGADTGFEDLLAGRFGPFQELAISLARPLLEHGAKG